MPHKQCAIYNGDKKPDGDEFEDDTPNLKNASKYLGIYQKEQDDANNYTILNEKIMNKAESIPTSNLTTWQKQKLFNSTVIPAAIYTAGNTGQHQHR